MPAKRWFVALPDGWTESLLRDVAKVNPPFPNVHCINGERRPLCADDLVSFCRMADVSEDGFIARKTDLPCGQINNGFTGFIEGDILVAKITPCFQNGKGARAEGLTNGVGFGSTEFHVIRPPNEDTGRWLRHVCRTHHFLSRGRRNMQGSAGQQRVPADFLKAFHVAVPPVAERRAIADVLDCWDKAALTLVNLVETRQTRKRALMQQLLTGKRRFPEFTGPWKMCRIRQFLKPRKELQEGNNKTPLYSLTIENGVTPKSQRYDRSFLVSKEREKRYKLVYPKDIVYNPSNLRWGAIGISRERGAVLVSPIYEVLHLHDPDHFDVDFVYHLLSSPRQIQIFTAYGEGTLIERIAVKVRDFLNVPVSMPLLPEQRKIAAVLDAADREIALLRRELELLRKQKCGLMQKLLTGQIRVKV